MQHQAHSLALTLLLAGTATATPPISDPTICDNAHHTAAADALVCYHDAVERQPLDYTATGSEHIAGVTQKRYQLNAQSWSPEHLVTPLQWQHNVVLHVPDDVLPQQALVIASNGTRYAGNGGMAARPPDDLSEILGEIARRTHITIVEVSDIPNQYLTYADDGHARREDESVAHGWSLFMQSPDTRQTLPLHVPMAIAITRAMDLAQRELPQLSLKHFAVTGSSKRGWAAWLTAIADDRVNAIIPSVTDILNTRQVLNHIYRTYGNHWPIGLAPYYAAGITDRLNTPQFNQLMRIEDPLSYLKTRYFRRLALTKYILSASGDDLFPPDSSHYYYDRLPGTKALRIVPNSPHNIPPAAISEGLTSFLGRLQQDRPLPMLSEHLKQHGAEATLYLKSNEQPIRWTLWTAQNTQARDFRYACGIRYASTSLPEQGKSVRVALPIPAQGWNSSFVEATYADGFIATSKAYVLGQNKYPDTAPPSTSPACSTLPGHPKAP
ncbi:PhoPQ-activated pathogenicity-related family protein [Xylella taiwanensis]|nr:PhoPQ-activated pathogenicity-related family protein [Xylella taiwanensis]MCD8457083.1 PhoPQ-activated pathogenicity-related family protein [Xylella taiwanensis]MCD8459492.1 PhoPQ-activated pathogenicity-related family protein [Xylella taiwanensis]MCD8461639.1 PhoPQ-activated pathogenicity-related family protein [Xylella taiwanensis]MCD8462333.1 PhoPQ-activated pathogenicity-related family protein [Xylella taiwanensis]MCD8468560.1 PhoPQ-activated pathogenicity-related family protein [Xylell